MAGERSADGALVIKRLEFAGPMAELGGWRPPTGIPEVAFSGRSNVGKSSLLNTLVHHKKLARVSNTPGRTREINFFLVNDTFYLADLPGYGYARVSKSAKSTWSVLIDEYLRSSPDLRGVVQLLDVRHDPTADDRRMLDFLAAIGVPTVVTLTKMDKLGASERVKRVDAITRKLGLDPDQVIPFSAHTRMGRDELAEAVVSLLEQPNWREAEPEPSDADAAAAEDARASMGVDRPGRGGDA